MGEFMYRRLYFIGIGVYLILLFFSFVFANERILFLDLAYNLFNILLHNGLCINHNRFGEVFTQLFPVVAMRGGLQLHYLVVFYSMGHVVFPFCAYLICGSLLKRYDFALVMLLQSILLTADTFYYLSQLPQAITLLMFPFAILWGRQRSSVGFLIAVFILAILVTVVFFHPLTLFVMLFCTIFISLDRQSIPNRKQMYQLAGSYFLVVLIKFICFRSPYESHSMSGMKNFITQFPNYITLYSNSRFLSDCLTKYCWVPVLFMAIVIFYTKSKEWAKLGFFVLFFLAYLWLVNVSYPGPETPEFYMENLYLPLGVFLAFPLVFDLLPVLDKKKLALPVVVFILVSDLVHVYAAHNRYSDRLNYERGILDKYGDQKVLISGGKTDTTQLMMLWGTPYEFLLLSESERGKAASILIDKHPEQEEWAAGLKNVLIVNWNIYYYKDLNPRYFHFTDSATGYMVIR